MIHQSLFETAVEQNSCYPFHISRLCSSLCLSPHSLVIQALCRHVQLFHIDKRTNHIWHQNYQSMFFFHIWVLRKQFEQTALSISSSVLDVCFLFLDILSQRHKRQPINPPSFQYNTKLTAWQAIMCYYTLTVVRISELNNNNNTSLNKNTLH